MEVPTAEEVHVEENSQSEHIAEPETVDNAVSAAETAEVTNEAEGEHEVVEAQETHETAETPSDAPDAGELKVEEPPAHPEESVEQSVEPSEEIPETETHEEVAEAATSEEVHSEEEPAETTHPNLVAESEAVDTSQSDAPEVETVGIVHEPEVHNEAVETPETHDAELGEQSTEVQPAEDLKVEETHVNTEEHVEHSTYIPEAQAVEQDAVQEEPKEEPLDSQIEPGSIQVPDVSDEPQMPEEKGTKHV